MSRGFLCITDKQPFQGHLLSKPTTDLKFCLPGDLNEGAVFPSVTDEWPVQDHLPTYSILIT